jgi:proteasome lid subunit RPN8/RPN11
MIRTLYMQQSHWMTMRGHVSDGFPLEACGLLAGVGNRVNTVLPLSNAAKSPVRFRVEPQAQYNAFEWMDANGLELVGIFHSHPNGPNTVSVRDIAEATYEVVNIVWSQKRGIWEAKGYWIAGERVTKVLLQVVRV